MRQARKLSESGFYHVVSKGEADQALFYSDDDRRRYVLDLGGVCEEYGLLLRSYCLMSNHVHLLVEDVDTALSAAMKELNERYAMYFKRLTGRTGHVFKNRFWSEPVEDEAYLLCAMRYIHANPAVAGICKAAAYPWSSARDYLGREGIANTELLLDMLGGRDGFIQFSRNEPLPAVAFEGSRLSAHLTDDELRRVAQEVVGDCDSLQSLGRDEQITALKRLLKCGFSRMEVVRATDLTKHFVYSNAQSE